MLKTVKSRAEEQFTSTQKKDKKALKDKEKARQERLEYVARLRSLRLAKEALDKEAAEAEAKKKPDTPVPNSAQTQSVPSMPQKGKKRKRKKSTPYYY